jgi:hypothetical protein
LPTHPEIGRLAAWRRLEPLELSQPETRSYRERIEKVAAAQREGRVGDSLAAADLFATIALGETITVEDVQTPRQAAIR